MDRRMDWNKLVPKKPFFYLRHGETDWNRRGVMQGQTDIPLNKTGRAQAALAAETAKSLTIGRIISSPLARAKDTALAVAAMHGLTPTYEPDFMEASFGEFEGTTGGEWVPSWVAGNSIAPGGESYNQAKTRTGLAYVRALEDEAPQPLLIVGHGRVYGALAEATSGAFFELPNAKIVYHQPDPRTETGWRVTLL